MDNYKKQILQRVIDFYIEKSDADKKTIRTVACLMNDIEAINYTRCCKSDSELLVCDDNELDCPYEFTSRCTMGRCDCKPKEN
tara:strand:+ start:213 stop:461 length:249 start_codon:yes stop_codon:yes gene_type:complete